MRVFTQTVTLLWFQALMHANCLTPKPLGVIFKTPSIIFYNTYQASLICPQTGIEV